MDIETYINILNSNTSSSASSLSLQQSSGPPKYTIINLDNPAHWVPILNDTKAVHYHNSSSNPPPPALLKALKQYIFRTNKKLYINNVQEQFYPETNCGPRALEYLLNQV